MERIEILNELQEEARVLSERTKWLQGNGDRRLAEFVIVQRMVNFKVQDIIMLAKDNNIENDLLNLNAELVSSAEYFRDLQLTGLAELYGAAIGALRKINSMLTDYLP